MIIIDYQSRIPIYEQIVSEIERYIAIGIYKPKQQIESIRELATTLGINPNTVKKAYDELEKRGTIMTISTKGTFIADSVKKVVARKVEEKINSMKEIIKELENLGVTKKEIIQKLGIEL